jgi:hypothetical protein
MVKQRPFRALLLSLVLLLVAGVGPAAAQGTYRVLPYANERALPSATPTPAPPQPASAYGIPGKTAPATGSYMLAFAGNAVSFDVSGFEPDFDPLYKVTISGTLRDRRPADRAFPAAMLVLSAYLEVFQPDTTPVLPDLLHPGQVANNLAGFLSGKAALVNVGGRIVYQGSLLAEVFQNSTEHLILDLTPLGSGASVRLTGAVTLHKGGAENATLHTLTPLARTALAVPRGPLPTWQMVVASISVRRPAMMGTAAPPGQQAPGKPATLVPLSPAHPTPAACDLLCRARGAGPRAVPLALGIALLLLGLVLAVRRLQRV